MKRYSDSLRGYGHAVYVRDNFTCQYCGFDGRAFPNWLQLSIDHVIPRNSGGLKEVRNLVTSCHACNSMTSRMQFPPGTSTAAALKAKRRRVRDRHRAFFDFWKEHVAPRFLDQPDGRLSGRRGKRQATG